MRHIILIAVIVLILFGSVRTAFFRTIGNWLDISDKTLPRASLIYVFAGGEDERPQYAARLYREGFAPRIMTASGVKSAKLLALGMKYTESDINRIILENGGVPARRIISDPRGSSTWDEVNLVNRYARRHDIRSIIFVTSNYHTRRVRLAARKAFRNDNVKLYYTSSQMNPRTNLNAWWQNEHGLITVNNEYIKLMFYTINYKIRKNPKWSLLRHDQTGG